ncbi:peptidase S10 [Rhodanobacter sp. AS-Z3]|uniref:S10 family peptidase n=1 Tax=Rhodanobacter sp. AS-Z3 TaxID=3031330 RepID=UPI00247832F7|nr:peptidase S10 [Rhodanobacter sp. AS-Z3]WEN15867.1 peptidase S10 [Rhodanobacter sp. AS-Z3]
MRHLVSLLLTGALALGCLPATGHADEPDAPAKAASSAAPEAAVDARIPTTETVVRTEHSVSIGGRAIKYTATAGTVIIRDDKNQPQASVFYVAYTVDDGKPSKRPVTFLYNGGPGSSSVWLHMGSFAPVRIETASPEATAPPPYHLVANSDSLLDKTDLVFIDAIGAGYSRPLGKATGKDFWGVDQDISAFSRAIQRYVTLNKRWNSPKFLYGESYGTTRSAALVDALQEKGMSFNGVILMSSILNYAVRMPGYDEIYLGYLPSYAAAAWYHNKIPNKPADLKTFVDQARTWARGPYAAALAQGQDLPAAQFDAIAAQMAAYTGLSVQYIQDANLRVDPSRFRKELLRDQRLTLGRYDSRFTGTDPDAAGETPDYDASDTGISGAFVAAFHEYLEGQLNYHSQLDYRPTYGEIGKGWDWKHKAAGSRRAMPLPYVAGDLAHAMRTNPNLKVLSVNGYYDFATPFTNTEYDLSHMNLDPSLRGNLSFLYYPSGHMIYLNTEALKQLKSDLGRFYDHTAPQR